MKDLVLYEHNRKAYEKATTLMNETGRAAVIHPTGTGKSFIAFKLAQEHPDSKILWLAPNGYIFRAQAENLSKVLKKDAGKEAEDTAREILKNITFMTYTKLMMSGDEISDIRPDYIVLDEFHRCGAPEWGNSVEKLLGFYPEAKLLGLSATNIRYLDNRRDMADELFDGNVASEMTLGEAMAKNILPAPKYVISIYSYKEELKRLSKKVEKEQKPELRRQNEKLLERLRRSLENAEGLDKVFARHMGGRRGKYLVFCAGKEHMDEMLAQSREWFRLIDEEPRIYAVYYDNPETGREFAEFKADESDHLRLLFCIDMLNEGVHVDDLDGVILLRPTVSPILYLQQIGRGLSAQRAKDEKDGSEREEKDGSYRQPVIFDIVNNFDSLSAVDALASELEEALGLMPCAEGERSSYSGNFRIVDELRDCRKIFKKLAGNLSASWEIYYAAAEEYYRKIGNLRVPKAFVTEQGLKLGSWLGTQRRVYSGKVYGHLDDDQIRRLEAIGMVWDDASERNFNQGLEELERYVKKAENANVPAGYVTEGGFLLGKWVGNIRASYKKNKLSDVKIHKLNRLGMIWDVREYRWNLNYNAAKAYYDMHGDLKMPHDYVTEDGLCLGRWVSDQIRTYNGLKSGSTPLTEEQIKRLETIGIVWKNKYEEGWDRKYELAKAYYEKYGNLDISSTCIIDGIDIGKWVNTIRLKMSNPTSSNLTLSKERINRMNEIGMEWDKKTAR